MTPPFGSILAGDNKSRACNIWVQMLSLTSQTPTDPEYPGSSNGVSDSAEQAMMLSNSVCWIHRLETAIPAAIVSNCRALVDSAEP